MSNGDDVKKELEEFDKKWGIPSARPGAVGVLPDYPRPFPLTEIKIDEMTGAKFDVDIDAVLERDQSVWIGEEEVGRFDPRTNQFVPIAPPEQAREQTWVELMRQQRGIEPTGMVGVGVAEGIRGVAAPFSPLGEELAAQITQLDPKVRAALKGVFPPIGLAGQEKRERTGTPLQRPPTEEEKARGDYSFKPTQAAIKEYEEWKEKLPWLKRIPIEFGIEILPDLPFYALTGGLPRALAGWRALATKPLPAKIAGRAALAPLVAVEEAPRLIIKGMPVAVRKTFDLALDAGLDKWLVFQGRKGESASVLFKTVLTPKNKIKITELATKHLFKRQAEAKAKKMGAQWAAREAAKDTMRDIEPLLLKAGEIKEPVVSKAKPTERAVSKVEDKFEPVPIKPPDLRPTTEEGQKALAEYLARRAQVFEHAERVEAQKAAEAVEGVKPTVIPEKGKIIPKVLPTPPAVEGVIPEAVPEVTPTLADIPIPNRLFLNESAIEAMAKGYREGNPAIMERVISVKRTESGFAIIEGHNRVVAAKEAGVEPPIVVLTEAQTEGLNAPEVDALAKKIYAQRPPIIPKPPAVEGVKEAPKPTEVVEVKPPTKPTLSKELTDMYTGVGEEVNAFGTAVKGVRGEEAKIARQVLKQSEKHVEHSKERVKTMASLESIKPVVKRLRQQIHIIAADKGLPKTQLAKIYKDTTGKAGLTRMTQPELESVLEKVRVARPVRIKGKLVIKAATEKNIQTLKAVLLKQGELDEAAYQAIKVSLGLPIDRYVDGRLFITEADGKLLIRTMNYEAEVGLFKTDLAAVKGLANNPELAKGAEVLAGRIEKAGKVKVVRKTTMNWRKLALDITDEPALHGINPLFDIRIAIQRLQEQVGGRAVSRISDVFDMTINQRLENDRRYDLMAHEITEKVPGLKVIINDKKSMERVSNWIAAKNKILKVESPELTESELKLAKAMEIAFFRWRNPVRYHRFHSWYSHFEGDASKIRGEIPDAPLADLKEAARIYESEGAVALRKYLDTKTWGIIGSGFEPHIAFNPKLQIRKETRAIIGKGHLKTREGVVFEPQEKTIWQRFLSYQRQMLNLSLEPYFNKMSREFDRITPHLSDVANSSRRLSTALREVRGFYVDEEAPQVFLRLGGYAFSVLSLGPHMFVRNLFQNLALLTDKSALLKIRPKTFTEARTEYIKTYISQFAGIQREQLLQQYMGQSPVERLIKKITYYPYSDSINRYGASGATFEKAGAAVRQFQIDKDVNKFLRDSGASEYSATEQIRILETLAQNEVRYGISTLTPVSGGEAAVRQLAEMVAGRKHFRYIRYLRSLSEMGISGRFIGSLVAFPRGYAQNLYLAGERLLSKNTTPAEKLKSMRVLISSIFGSLVSGYLYQKLTGKPRNPYNPLQVLTWTPGGLALGAAVSIAETLRQVTNVLIASNDEQRSFALNELTKSVPQLGDMFIPFYLHTMNIIEAATDQKYLDRKWARQIREIFDKEYKLNPEFYKKERTVLGMFQHAIFSGEEAEPSDFEKAQSDITEAMGKVGKIDTESRARAMEGVTYEPMRKEIWNRDWTYSTGDLYNDLNRAKGKLRDDQLTTGDGFPKIMDLFLESQGYIDYYYLHTTEGRADLRETSREYNTHLFFWGKVSKLYGDTEEAAAREAIVRGWMRTYGIPQEAMPLEAFPKLRK